MAEVEPEVTRCGDCGSPMVDVGNGTTVCPVWAQDDPAVRRWFRDMLERAKRDADLLALARGERGVSRPPFTG